MDNIDPELWILVHGVGGLEEHKAIPPEVVEHVLASADPALRGALANNPHTAPEILDQFASDPDPTTRMHVARNRNTPTEGLRRLLQGPGETVIHRDARISLFRRGEPFDPNTKLRMSRYRPRIIPAVREAIRMAVGLANGKRRTRILDPSEVEDDVLHVVRSGFPIAAAHSHGGSVASSYGYPAYATTSLVLRPGYDFVFVDVREGSASGTGGYGNIGTYQRDTPAGDTARSDFIAKPPSLQIVLHGRKPKRWQSKDAP